MQICFNYFAFYYYFFYRLTCFCHINSGGQDRSFLLLLLLIILVVILFYFLPSFCKKPRFFYLVASKVLPKEIFKLRLCYQVLNLKTTFILIPLLDHRSAKKRGGKNNTVRLVNPSSFKIVFTLLEKVVAVQV